MDTEKLIQEGLAEEGEEVWDEYRQYDPSSLHVIVEYTRDFISDLQAQGSPQRDNLRVLLTRMYVALSQLRLRIINLQKPPKFGDLSTSIPLWLKDELGDDTVQNAVRDQHMWAEFQKRKDEVERVADLRQELADKYDVGEGTVRRAVYGD